MLINRRKIALFKLAYVLFILTAAFLTYTSSPEIFGIDPMYKVGQVFGVVALSGLTVQLILSGRVKFLEKGIGLDRMMRWHLFNGIVSTGFILLHPVFLFFRPLVDGVPVVNITRTFGFATWLGVATAGFLLVTVFAALFSQRVGLKYEQWRAFHRFTLLILAGAFIHSYFVGSDIFTKQPLFYWWLALLIVSLAVVVHKFVIRPQQLKENLYEVVKTESVTPNVNTVFIKPFKKKLTYKPGQFVFIRFYSENLPNEEHPFTISSSPTENAITFSIKDSGDFTRLIGELKPKDKAVIEGPFGVFSNYKMRGPFIFIAGGIGITPFRSMLKYMKDSGGTQDTVLLYANRTFDDIAFYNELEELGREDWFTVSHILSHEQRDGFAHGYITNEFIKEKAGTVSENFTRGEFFICGPPGMMKIIQAQLIKLGVNPKNIHTEKFALK
jgi:predicted ferric reductase